MKKIYEFFLTQIIAKIKWDKLSYLILRKKYGLKWQDHKTILEVLSKGNYIILTWRSTHLTSYLISLGDFLLTGKFNRVSHALMNIELVENVNQSNTVFIEATGEGVHKSSFYDVFNCERALILKPIEIPGLPFDWEQAIHEILSDLGRKYDNYFNIDNDSELSCAELILDAIKRDKYFLIRFHGLLAMIKNEGNLTPSMFLNSGSFEVVLDIYRPLIFGKGYSKCNL